MKKELKELPNPVIDFKRVKFKNFIPYFPCILYLMTNASLMKLERNILEPIPSHESHHLLHFYDFYNQI